MSDKPIKLIKSGREARKELLTGANIVADAVRATLGPGGRNTIVGRNFRTPKVSNDGLYAANQIILENEIQNLGAQAMVSVAQKTADEVGDGTSTGVVIAQKLLETSYDKIDNGAPLGSSKVNANLLRKEMLEAKEQVVQKLKERAEKAETVEDLAKVATTSVENAEYGQKIAEMTFQLGKDGFIYVEEGFSSQIEYEVAQGMSIRGKLTIGEFANDKKQAVHEDIGILITNEELNDILVLQKLVEGLNEKNEKKVVIMTPKFGKGVDAAIYMTATKGNLLLLPVKIPALSNDEMEDVAVYTGAQFLDTTKGFELKNASYKDLGRVKKIIATMDNTVLMGGVSEVLIQARVQKLKEHLKLAEVDIEKNILKRRIGTLSGGIGVIRVGGLTEEERGYWKDKFDDAVPATKAAFNDGMVKGAGRTLKEIAEELPESILTEALKAPYEQVKKNLGEEPGEALDPVKVEIVALENAVSLASTLCTVETAIAYKNEDLAKKLQELLK